MQTTNPFAESAGIVLAGGRSARMGSSKAALGWHGSTLLRRVSGIVARSVGRPVVVVAAAGQALPALPASVEVVADSLSGRGPLQGLADGLAAIGERAAVAYVSSVDVPLLHPAFVQAVAASIDSAVDIAVPEVDGRLHPLAAAYRVGVLGVVRELLAQDRLALNGLLERCRVRRLSAAQLPAPQSVTNLNERGDYQAALWLPAPAVVVNGSEVRAWTLGDVLRGHRAVALNGETVAPVALNGETVAPDPELPLVAGDVVTLNWGTA